MFLSGKDDVLLTGNFECSFLHGEKHEKSLEYFVQIKNKQ